MSLPVDHKNGIEPESLCANVNCVNHYTTKLQKRLALSLSSVSLALQLLTLIEEPLLLPVIFFPMKIFSWYAIVIVLRQFKYFIQIFVSSSI